jgi:hypothetical protein
MALAILTFIIMIVLCLVAVLFFGAINSESFLQKKMIIRNYDQEIIFDDEC